MRLALVLVLAVVAACADRPTLPPPVEITTNVAAIDVSGDTVYWTRVSAVGVTLHRYRHGELATLDRIAGPVEGGRPFVIATEGGVLWGFTGAFASCGHARFFADGAEPADVPPGSFCQRLPLDLFAGRVTIGYDTGTGAAVEQIALAGGAVEPAFALNGLPQGPVVRTSDRAYAVIADEVRWGGTVVAFERLTPHSASTLAGAIRDPGGLAVDDDRLLWIDNGAYGDPARILALPIEHAQDPPAVVTELPGPARELTTTCGAAWMIDGPRGAPLRTLTALRDDQLTTYDVDYDPVQLAGAGDRLVVVSVDDPAADWPILRVLLQPLD